MRLLASGRPLGVLVREGSRYTAASAVALALDFGVYVSLIRLAEVSYLLAAPVGFAVGLAAVYTLSVRWVFQDRRLASARLEFTIFALIGLAGMALNQGALFVGVEWLRLSYEAAKFVSAGIVFCFNFGARKLLLFTPRA
ncbi:MAG TPA: GtrA family protein [Burkholderiales bacterium]|nr:GtrA family protein [Burkholderiales bacterium]